MSVDRTGPSRPLARDHNAEEYRDYRPQASQQVQPVVESAPRYVPPNYDYQYRHPNQVPPASTSPTHSYDRTPFSAAPYTRQYADYNRYAELGHIGIGSDSKQRKRRGNLPKETTDKLRSWFMAHLSHPYPTEDEKQELMRQTGLQMSEFETSGKTPTTTNEVLSRSNFKLVHQCQEAPAANYDQQCPGGIGRHEW